VKSTSILVSGFVLFVLAAKPGAEPDPTLTGSVAPAPLAATLRALEPNKTYKLVQYECIAPVATSDPDHLNKNRPRLVELPTGITPYHGSSPVYYEPSRFRAKVVGWVLCDPPDANGKQTQRWLLLHETKRASDVDFEITPATVMGGTFPAPTNGTDFANRAKTIFDAARLSSPDPDHDATRYVKVCNVIDEITDDAAHVPADHNLPGYPNCGFAAGNGLWDGGNGWQLDNGTVGLYQKSVATSPLNGIMVENNSGSGGTEVWYLQDGFAAPTATAPLIVAAFSYCGTTDDDDIGELLPGNTQRQWNVVVESGTYYQTTFPSSP